MSVPVAHGRMPATGDRAGCRRTVCALPVLLGLWLLGCDAIQDRYLEAECRIPELASQAVRIEWFDGVEVVDGSPVIDKSHRQVYVPAEDVGRMRQLALKDPMVFLGELEHAKGSGGAVSPFEMVAKVTLDSSGRTTVHFVRQRAVGVWIEDPQTGEPLATADGLMICGARTEWICVVPRGTTKGVLWRRSVEPPESWKPAGVVERTRVVSGGDVWSVMSVP